MALEIASGVLHEGRYEPGGIGNNISISPGYSLIVKSIVLQAEASAVTSAIVSIYGGTPATYHDVVAQSLEPSKVVIWNGWVVVVSGHTFLIAGNGIFKYWVSGAVLKGIAPPVTTPYLAALPNRDT